ncbi:MAG TPA: proton-conducting transporter membrane subunit [Anaerolineae bacterium]
MSILPLLPIIILLGGALAIALSRLAHFRQVDALASVVSLLALAAMIVSAAAGFQMQETLVSTWQPLSVFGVPVSLRVDRVGWSIGFVAVLACAATALAGLAYPGRRRFGPRALALGMTAALVGAVFAANLLTLALAWGLFDALFAIAALMRSEGAQAGRRAAFAIGFNGAATVSLWIAALMLNQAHESLFWHLTHLTDSARGFLTAAAIFRLGLYPLSQWLPAERDDAPGRVALLYVLPPLAGLYILIRLAELNAVPQEPVLIWLGALSILIGGALAWLRSDSRDALPYVSLSSLGAIVLAGASGQPASAPQALILSGAGSWALAIMTLSLSRTLDRQMPWWSVGHALALATLAGVPATLGLAVQTGLAAGVASSDHFLLIACMVIGQALTFGALLRLMIAPAQNPPPSGVPATITYIVALALVAPAPFLLPALARSAVPEWTPPAFEVVLSRLGALGGVILIMPIALAIALVWLGRGPTSVPRFNPGRLLNLDWLYDLLFQVVNVAVRYLSNISALVEGEGAVLWALLILIATYVVLSGTIQ